MFYGINLCIWAVDYITIFALTLAVCLTLNLEAGYAGIPNFGKVLFVAGGATIAGSACGHVAALVLAVNTGGNFNRNIPFVIDNINKSLAANPILSVELLLLGILLAAGVGAGMGLVASFPAIRLREDYLGMLLLAAAQFFQLFLSGYEPFIAGQQGLIVPDVFGWARNTFGPAWLVNVETNVQLNLRQLGVDVRDVFILTVTLTFALVVYIYVEKVARSPLGRSLRAIRDNEDASRALGKNDVALRRKVLVIGSAISAIAGALLTFYTGSVEPGTWTRIDWTFYIWVMVIIGGSANNLGAALGAFAFTFGNKVLATVQVKSAPYLSPIYVSLLNWIIYLAFGGLLIVFLLFRPDGIVPEKSSATVPKWKVAWILERESSTTTNDPPKKESTPRDRGETGSGSDGSGTSPG